MKTLILLLILLAGCGQAVPPIKVASDRSFLSSNFRDVECDTYPKQEENPSTYYPNMTGLVNKTVWGCARESSTVFFKGDLYVFTYGNVLDSNGNTHYGAKVYDYFTKKLVSFDDQGATFTSAIVKDDILYYYSSDGKNIMLRTTVDLKTWSKVTPVIRVEEDQVFNTSVTEGPDGYVMVYEVQSNNGPYSFKAAKSKDLVNWQTFGNKYSDTYAACPIIKYANGAYQIIYLQDRTSELVSVATSTNDFISYSSPSKIVVAPGQGDGINASDVDLFEYEGKTYLSYMNGNQRDWGIMSIMEFNGNMDQFFQAVWN